MRHKRTSQVSIFEAFAAHDIGRELAVMSQWLDEHDEVLEWVHEDLRNREVKDTGRSGMSSESALRCALLKQHRRLSYEELSFHLQDSLSFQAFARLPLGMCAKKSVLQGVISSIGASTWARINESLKGSAREERFEPGRRVRIDSTVTDSPVHEPSDSSLLWDGVRVMVGLLEQARGLEGAPKLYYVNHRRLAKKRARAIWYARGSSKRELLYRDLLKVTRATLGYVDSVGESLKEARLWGAGYEGWMSQVKHYSPLIEGVIDQTERRVLCGETVPSAEKVLSLFEEHTDIIVKGSRDVQYGHKLNLVSGRSGLILDVVTERGNPADAQRYLPMLERHCESYGVMPRQVAADGGYASVDNMREAKRRGVEDVAFHKKRGLSVEEMVKSKWVYRRLRNFRAGIEAGISCLKRAYGLGRCTWKGLTHFEAYVWSSIVAYNLSVYARHRLA